MRHALRLQYTNIRSALVDGRPQIELQHVAKDESGQPHRTEWIHMNLEDASKLATEMLTAARSEEANDKP